ncbi:hypothetical protein V6Z11_D07G106100 [Gossypium hirsutum]
MPPLMRACVSGERANGYHNVGCARRRKLL